MADSANFFALAARILLVSLESECVGIGYFMPDCSYVNEDESEV